MNKALLKEIGIYAAIVAFFLVLSYAFVPDLLSGKIVDQSDIRGWQGMAHESLEWNKANPDDPTAWTDSMFGGMPNVTFVENFKGDWTKALYNALLWGKRPASYIFLALLGGFLMMLSMGVRKSLAVIGAIAVAFCSYNFQIIQVGHNTKMQAIAFAPWALAAMFYTYRMAKKGRYAQTALGAVLFALALSFQIKANHVQITYYLAIIIAVYAISSLIRVLLQKNKEQIVRFMAASAMLLVFGLIGIGTNANKLLPTWEYAPFTMRGGSELAAEEGSSKGLDLDYATSWSYGIEETPNLMIPNFNGGSSSGRLGRDSEMWKLFAKAGQNPAAVCNSLPLYWGPQPFTAGPMYIGAISIFLFILGLCVLEGRKKWWIAVCVLLAIMLSWGNHLMWFTEFWFKYVPMYNKFRTVSMALVILQFCVPLLGIYTLERILRQDIPARNVVRGIWISFGVTAGFCALFALIPALAGDFSSASDSQMQDVIVEALVADRISIFRADAWLSFLCITLAAAALMFCYMKTDPNTFAKRSRMAMGVIGVLVLANMWFIGKRYLNSSHFVTPKNFSAQFKERTVDELILEDKDPSYRVLDLSESTFNSSVSSYRHKSIGGYSPTKMQRYQDLIDYYITREVNGFLAEAKDATTIDEMQAAVPYMPVLSMLNDRYIILGAEYPPLINRYAFGEAWFVDQLVKVENANAEISMLGRMDLRKQAVVRSDRFDADVKGGANADIMMLSYAPNELHYLYESDAEAAVVFSEIYHPSWVAQVTYTDENGVVKTEDLPLFQANWTLRGAILPAGEGEIVMRYEPADYVIGARISLLCSILMLLIALAAAAMLLYPKLILKTPEKVKGL